MSNKNFNLVQVNTILENEIIKKYFNILSRPIVTDIIRYTLDKLRENYKKNNDFKITKEEIISLCEKNLKSKSNLPIKKTINATGTIMHTNLGRSPIDEDIWDSVRDINIYSNNLEYNINNEGRGLRGEFLYNLLAKLTGAEDAVVVNNNAAALFLILKTFAVDKEVIVSRGEQVQVGGGFRIPDILKESGAKLIEVGTTNIVTIEDYKNAITENTSLILKVHNSNFRIRGFTKSPSLKTLRENIDKSIPIVYDEGAGIFDESISEDEHIRSAIKAGIDLVCFSGDKMFSSVQAGIIVGRKDFIAKIYKNPLMRAFRCGKTVLSILEKYAIKRLNSTDMFKGYCERLISIEPKKIKEKCETILKNIDNYEKYFRVIEEEIETGGGAMADIFFKSYAIQFQPKDLKKTIKVMHNLDIPIIAKVKKEFILIYTITIFDNDIDYVSKSLQSLIENNLIKIN